MRQQTWKPLSAVEMDTHCALLCVVCLCHHLATSKSSCLWPVALGAKGFALSPTTVTQAKIVALWEPLPSQQVLRVRACVLGGSLCMGIRQLSLSVSTNPVGIAHRGFALCVSVWEPERPCF